ncbi:hypothetical protein [Lacrimispora brassicae]
MGNYVLKTSDPFALEAHGPHMEHGSGRGLSPVEESGMETIGT